MGFRLSGLKAERFVHLYGATDDLLKAHNTIRLIARPDSPCRVSLRDASVGEPLLLLEFQHQDSQTPYRSSGPIFIQEGQAHTGVFENDIPPEMQGRNYSVRIYDTNDMLVTGKVIPGDELKEGIADLFRSPAASYLHLHHAGYGCFACRVDRT
jgi:hypothetical protein